MLPFWDNKNEKIFLFRNFRLWLSSYVQNDLNTQLTPSLLALLPTTPQKLPDMKLSPMRMSTLLYQNWTLKIGGTCIFQNSLASYWAVSYVGHGLYYFDREVMLPVCVIGNLDEACPTIVEKSH